MPSTLARKMHEDGIALFRKGRLEEADEKLNEALENTGDDSQQAAEIYNDLGVVYTQLEDYEAAYEALDEAMARFTALGHKKGQAQAMGNRAAVYQAEGMMDEAVEAYKESARMLEELGENELAMYVWQAISKLRMKQGQYIAAIGAYEEGVENMPQSSFKRKVLQKILKAPNSILGSGGPAPDDDDYDEEDDDEPGSDAAKK